MIIYWDVGAWIFDKSLKYFKIMILFNCKITTKLIININREL